MAKTITPDQINDVIIKVIVAKYKELQIKLPEYLKQFIYSEFYDQYQPSEYYERQYRIIDAIMVSNIRLSGKELRTIMYPLH